MFAYLKRCQYFLDNYIIEFLECRNILGLAEI